MLCYSTLPPAGLEEPSQVELLLMENERLRQELESHREKSGRIHKVRDNMAAERSACEPHVK